MTESKYVIMSSSEYGTEEIDTADTLEEARYLVQEYIIAFGRGWSVWYKRNNKWRQGK